VCDFDDFFDDFGDLEDFAWVGGVLGMIEEEIEEDKRFEREMENEIESTNALDGEDHQKHDEEEFIP